MIQVMLATSNDAFVIAIALFSHTDALLPLRGTAGTG